jgi:hypothetical protein
VGVCVFGVCGVYMCCFVCACVCVSVCVSVCVFVFVSVCVCVCVGRVLYQLTTDLFFRPVKQYFDIIRAVFRKQTFIFHWPSGIVRYVTFKTVFKTVLNL